MATKVKINNTLDLPGEIHITQSFERKKNNDELASKSSLIKPKSELKFTNASDRQSRIMHCFFQS